MTAAAIPPASRNTPLRQRVDTRPIRRNSRSCSSTRGPAAARRRRAAVAEHARERGVETVVLAPDASLDALVAEAVASGADALGVAGGDGSLAVGAAAALAHGIPFVCIPAGTRNHFALDVGVDRRDVVGALDAFTDGVERRIDVAEVNGRLFLNNVSLGIYGDAVRATGVPRREGAHAAGHRERGRRSGRCHARVERGGRPG